MNKRIRTPQPPRADLPGFTPELLLEVFDEPIVCHRVFVSMTGQIGAALILTYASQATEKLSAQDRKTGWFTHTREQWKQDTGLSDIEFGSAKRRLVEVGLIEERVAAVGGYEFRLVPERLQYMMQRQADAKWKGCV